MHLTVASVVCPYCACTVHSAHIDAVSIPVREIEQHTWQFYAHAGATAIQVSEQKPISSLFDFFFFPQKICTYTPRSHYFITTREYSDRRLHAHATHATWCSGIRILFFMRQWDWEQCAKSNCTG